MLLQTLHGVMQVEWMPMNCGVISSNSKCSTLGTKQERERYINTATNEINHGQPGRTRFHMRDGLRAGRACGARANGS